MDDLKVYTPTIVQDTPFPGNPIVPDTQTQSSTGGNYTPTTTNEKTFPKKKVAYELLSTVLNTRSRKILKEFTLQQSGGFQIGNFEEGETGDIRLTPDGITARDKAGLTTFALDGDSGDAVFKGTIQAGATIIADTIVTEQASSGNGRTVYYNDGIPAIVIGDPD